LFSFFLKVFWYTIFSRKWIKRYLNKSRKNMRNR
jgi:hypothetical protein